MVGSKQPTPVWLSPEEANQVFSGCSFSASSIANFFFVQHCIAGASVWKFASVDGGIDPDV
jgi:xylulose-5-phosphate/fructose-6-phosphate phosphoketolase